MKIENDSQYREAWDRVDDHMLNRTMAPKELDELLDAIFEYEDVMEAKRSQGLPNN